MEHETRSRGISHELCFDNRPQTTSQSSSDSAMCPHNQRFADKVRRVTYQGLATPENRKDHDGRLQMSNSETSNQAGHLCCHNEQNRRSQSYSREARSPSWNDDKFNSSAVSSNTKKANSATDANDERPELNTSNLSVESTPLSKKRVLE